MPQSTAPPAAARSDRHGVHGLFSGARPATIPGQAARSPRAC
ncbi:hypothetical protein [Streptomyces sp. NPDC058874]